MPEPTTNKAIPTASRPYAPNYGIKAANEGSGLLPWSWAEQRLQKCKNFYLSTVSPEGRPHVMPLWGLWLDSKFFFSTGKNSRKARNLAGNPHCTVATGNAEEAVILEGTASLVSDRQLCSRFVQAVSEKYKFDMGGYAEEPIYALQPRRAFGLIEKDFVGSATRWTWN